MPFLQCQANSEYLMLLSATSGEVKKVQGCHKSTNKGAIASWTLKSGGCKTRKEFGEVTKFYSPKSDWLRLYRIYLIFMTERKKNQTS